MFSAKEPVIFVVVLDSDRSCFSFFSFETMNADVLDEMSSSFHELLIVFDSDSLVVVFLVLSDKTDSFSSINSRMTISRLPRYESGLNMSDYDCPTTSVHNLKEQVWYRGMLTRVKSEQLLREDGEFLVRDSISMPGEYVLTAMWKGRALHFQINTAYENGKKEFHLEEESFASVPSLVNFYKSHRRPVTAASGCIISTPVDRDRESGSGGAEIRELEASYMHVLKPHMSQAPVPRSLSQRVLLNQTALRQYAADRQQRPKSSISQHQMSIASEPVSVPPVPAALANRPLPLPIRSPRNTHDDDEDYSEMDYDAMDGILDACSLSNTDRARSSSTNSIPSMMSRQFQSCQNLSYRSLSPCTVAKVPPPLPARPPLPPRPNFKMDTSTVADEGDHSQPEDARDSAFVDYDEPRTKLNEDDYDKLPSTRPCSSEPERNRLSGSSDCDSADSGVRDSRDSGIYRTTVLRYACLLSILYGARKDAHLMLKKWILVGVSLARHGDAFACACIANLKQMTWLWKSLDPHAKSELAALKSINESLLRGEKLETHNYATVVPFLQPALEIMSGQDSHYLDGSSFASEVGMFELKM
ncbi:unnamed protein product [Nippostrongylus brasiliensis]|uniref:SH2 domain-containing protein n=1 Tax=Nippostrongylus brasiliensis TaxID=27835 RepID=A0A158QXA3_NIPBR|nr:unnamed protein product [Nippostrongylus brasiliensis]